MKSKCYVVMLCLFFLNSTSCFALTFNKIFAFGDSLTDGGFNATAVQSYAKINNISNTCGYESRYTNGLTTVEQAAVSVSLFQKTTFENYAIAGQVSGDIASQIKVMLKRHRGRADAYALNVIFIGANDIGPLLTNLSLGVSSVDDALAQSTISEAINRLDASLKTLLAKGARKILFVNLPNFRYIPEIKNLGRQDLTQDVVQNFNLQLAEKVLAWDVYTKAKYKKSSVKLFDIYTRSNELFAAAAVEENTGHPLIDDSSTVTERCAQLVSAGQYPNYNWPVFDKDVFYDGVHFSRRAHSFFGYQLGDFLASNYQ